MGALSGWADPIESICSGRTEHLRAAAALGGAGYPAGRPGPELRQVLGHFLGSRPDREPQTIELGNVWGDAGFPPHPYARTRTTSARSASTSSPATPRTPSTRSRGAGPTSSSPPSTPSTSSTTPPAHS
ncbi:hypothetical protein [Streptomyces sp. NBC_01278]|uniref:hypothetical protein n=1 Tax=Streptomyces sp. NBC_01278 TaxID=2903809 RepID=UPI003FCE2951